MILQPGQSLNALSDVHSWMPSEGALQDTFEENVPLTDAHTVSQPLFAHCTHC